MTSSLTAHIEMTRLRGTCAWSPCSKVSRKYRNQHCTRYTFEDSSVLTVYLNGDASWFYRDKNGCSDGEQRWRNWHGCNTHGRG